MSEINFEKTREKLLQFNKEHLKNARGNRTSPMGKLFDKLSKFLDIEGKESDQVDVYYSKLEDSEKEIAVLKDESIRKRETVIQYLLNNLLKIHKLSLKTKSSRKDLISIPLYDMKIVGKLINVIVTEGIYSCLPAGTGIPLEKRRLKNFEIPLKFTKVGLPRGESILEAIIVTFIEIYKEDSDLKDLLIQGTGFTDVLTASITLSTFPEFQDRRENFISQFKELEKSSGTFNLLSTYGLFIASPLQPYFKSFVINRLSLLPYERSNGVQSLIEMVLGLRDTEQVEISKAQHVITILMNKPKQIGAKEYFTNIGDQMYEILVLLNRPILISVVCHILEQLDKMNKSIILDHILLKVSKAFCPVAKEDGESIVLTTETQLNNSFNVILSLVSHISSRSILSKLFAPIYASLWSYMMFKKKAKLDYKVVQQIFTVVLDGPENTFLLDMLLLSFGSTSGGTNWDYAVGENNLVYIKERVEQIDSKTQSLMFFDAVDESINVLVDILQESDDELAQNLFSIVLQKWLSVNQEQNSFNLTENSYQTLIYLKVLGALIEKVRNKLINSPIHLLNTVEAILLQITQNKRKRDVDVKNLNIVEEEADSDDEDDEDLREEDLQVADTALDFVSSALSTNPGSFVGEKEKVKLKEILGLLKTIKNASSTMESCKSNIEELLFEEVNAQLSQRIRKEENDKMMERILEKINDQQPPIRVHGLKLLRDAFMKESSTIRLDYVVNMHISQLSDNEPFVYLSSIKGLEELLQYESNESEILEKLLSIYVSPKMKLDQKLRVGEILSRFVSHNSSSALIAAKSELIAKYCLSLIRRDDKHPQDITLRMSAMSLLGVCCHVAPAKVSNYIQESLDCVLGILTMEKSTEEAVLRRAAIILVVDLVSSEGGLRAVPPGYGPRLSETLAQISETDNDLLVRGQATSTLIIIDELFETEFKKALN